MSGLLVGLLFGAGLLLATAAWRAAGPPPPLLAALQRVPAFAPARPPEGAWSGALRPLSDGVARLFGGHTALERRLRLAGDPIPVQRYLLRQVLLAGVGAAAALLLVVGTGAVARLGPSLILLAAGIVGGLLLGDFLLTRRIAARRTAMAEQFPVAAQLLALLMAAGAGPSDAIGRVGAVIGGPMGAELVLASQRMAGGAGFAASMRAFAASADLPVVERFVSGLVSAVERGSPLSDLMRAQALDAAAESHRQLMAQAGRKDVAMLVPVVFAVLPCVVVVALLPGAVQLGIFGG